MNKMMWAAVVGFIMRLYIVNNIPHSAVYNDNDFSNSYDSKSSMIEAIALYKDGFSPYEGGIFHGTPLMLIYAIFAERILSDDNLSYIIAAVDVLIGIILYKVVQRMSILMSQTVDENNQFSRQYTTTVDDTNWKSLICLFFYILNPVPMISIAFRGFGVILNLALSLFLYSITKREFVISSFFLAFCIHESIYAFVFIIPAIFLCRNLTGRFSSAFLRIALPLSLFYCGMMWTSYVAAGNSFLHSSVFHSLWIKPTHPSPSLLWMYPHLIMPFFKHIWLSLFPLTALVISLAVSISLKNSPCILLIFIANFWSFINPASTLTTYLVGYALMPCLFHLYRGYPQIIIFDVLNFVFPVIIIAVRHVYTTFMTMSSTYYFSFVAIYSLSKVLGLTDILNMHLIAEFYKENGVFADRNYEYQENLKLM